MSLLPEEVLIVDEDKMIHIGLKKILSEFNVNVLSCTDAETATQICKEKVFKLIIVDPMLPSSFEGEDFIKEQRQFYSINKDTPIIVFTEDIDYISRITANYDVHPESKVGELKKIIPPIKQALGS